jgi:hypothetical protein
VQSPTHPRASSSSAPAATPATATPTTSTGVPDANAAVKALALIGDAPGTLGIIVFDRTTGATWRAGTTTHLTWTASTIKLAIVTELLERDRSGDITLSTGDRSDIADILNWSSDDAATALWNKYGKDAMAPRFQTTYGMKTLTFITGFKRFWGHMKCTAEDLMHLVRYVMSTLNATDRAYIVSAMQHPGTIQQWGVWAAGPSWHPGGKDGWSIEPDGGSKHWVTNSVGFAGPNQRYLVALMYQLPPGKTIDDGVHTVSNLVATVFGAPVPAKVTVPDPSTGL